jgi:hypothetical protein
LNAVIPADCESGRSAALTAEIAELVALTNTDRTKTIAGDLKAQQDAAAAAVKLQQANAALAIVFSQMDIDLQSQRDQILAELQSAVAQRQQAWDVQTLKIKSQIASFLNLGVSESDATYWGTCFGTFVDSVGETFVDGRAWDSLQGATTQMLDVMAIGITDFSEWIHPLYGHHGAHEAGTYVGTVWGTANWIAISFFSGGGSTQLFSYFEGSRRTGGFLAQGRVFLSRHAPGTWLTQRGFVPSLVRFGRTGRWRPYSSQNGFFVTEVGAAQLGVRPVPFGLTRFWKPFAGQFQTRLGISGFQTSGNVILNQPLRSSGGQLVNAILYEGTEWTARVLLGINLTLDYWDE